MEATGGVPGAGTDRKMGFPSKVYSTEAGGCCRGADGVALALGRAGGEEEAVSCGITNTPPFNGAWLVRTFPTPCRNLKTFLSAASRGLASRK